MLDLVPAEVADVDQALYAVLKLGKYAEVGDVADGSGVTAADGILLADVLPRIDGELLEAEGNLAGLAVDAEDLCLNLVALLEELLGAVKPGAPGHLADVNETLNAGFDLDECTVVCEQDDLTLDLEKLEYVSSSGLRQIIAAYKKMKSFRIKNVSGDIMEVLRMTGFDKRLNIV